MFFLVFCLSNRWRCIFAAQTFNTFRVAYKFMDGFSDWVRLPDCAASGVPAVPAFLFLVSVNLRCDKTIWCYRRALVVLGAVGTFTTGRQAALNKTFFCVFRLPPVCVWRMKRDCIV